VLKFVRSRRWLAVIVVVVILAGLVAGTYFVREETDSPAGHAETDLPAAAEAPPDLQKLQDAYASGRAALERKDGEDAVKHLSSFDFGPRRVEEYRLYQLAQAYEITGNKGAARVTLAKLMRREPRFVYVQEAGLDLAKRYAETGDSVRTAAVAAQLTRRSDVADVAAGARWIAATQRLYHGDVSGALFAARNILIHHPRSDEAKDAAALVRALTKTPDKVMPALTPSERVERAKALMRAKDSQTALEELTALEPNAGGSRSEVVLQKGIALHLLKRYEDSIKVLEPLTSGPYKYAIPALRYASRNYAIVSAAINPVIFKTVKERKQVGTIKQRVGKGKKRRTITKPKYQDVFRQVKLIDLPKKNKKDEYERLASERLKDLLMLAELDDNVRLETLNVLAARATAKNQDGYVQELVPQIIKLDPLADPSLQHFWDKGWGAYERGDLAGARKMFRFIADTYTHPNVKRQSEYWYARCLDRAGQKEEAAAIYQKLASAPYADLYAMHAVNRGAKRQETKSNPLKKEGPDWREIAEKEMPDELQLAYELTALSSMRDGLLELRRNMRRENTRFAEALMAEHHHAAGREVDMYRSLRRAWPQLATVEQDSVPVYFLRMYYPIKYGDDIEEYSKDRGLDPNLVRALILQESYYNPKAKSRVGATGLMQLMPPTAKEHAAKMRIPFAVSRLENPEVNIRIGTYHLKMLIDMFSGNTYLAVASYNAGQGNIMKWRRGAPRKPMDEFLESIPFQETRNYVKRVTMLRSSYGRLTS
jgi:soluble lytic murein transglycosylase-like protein